MRLWDLLQEIVLVTWHRYLHSLLSKLIIPCNHLVFWGIYSGVASKLSCDFPSVKLPKVLPLPLEKVLRRLVLKLSLCCALLNRLSLLKMLLRATTCISCRGYPSFNVLNYLPTPWVKLLKRIINVIVVYLIIIGWWESLFLFGLQCSGNPLFRIYFIDDSWYFTCKIFLETVFSYCCIQILIHSIGGLRDSWLRLLWYIQSLLGYFWRSINILHELSTISSAILICLN